MNVPVSLLKKDLSEVSTIKKNSPYKVYIEDSDGTTYSTKLPAHVQTVQEAIIQAIKKFNHNLSAGLTLNPNCYQLYIAKNGRKNSGLPSLDKTQSIQKVGKEKFFLSCLQKSSRMSSLHSLESIKPIEVDFEKKEKKHESGKQKGIFCFCGGW